MRFFSELEVACGAGGTKAAISLVAWQQTDHASQSLPGRLVEGWVGADQFADHLPGGDIERSLRRRSHRQGDRTLRTEADSLGCRLLPGPYANGLREHVHCNRFVSGFEFAVTAKAI